MAVRSVKNQYLGINAHLHSLWQSQGGWPEFHTRYLVNLADSLLPTLLPMGYSTRIEPSLQIRRIDLWDLPENPVSDLTIYDLNPLHPTQPQDLSAFSNVSELVLPLTETLLVPPRLEREFNTIRIYDVREGQGEPVVWIELLSPSNKTGSDAKDYLEKRQKILESEIVFVEIDYLHETPPTIPKPAKFRSRYEKPRNIPPHPYYIFIADPRPSYREGVIRVNGFDVDQQLPTLQIALNGDDVLTLDFGKPYNHTLEAAFYGPQFVDYGEFPENFDRYHEDDQRRIALRMLSVLEAAQAGVDLESGPFAVKDLSLEEALKAIEAFKS